MKKLGNVLVSLLALSLLSLSSCQTQSEISSTNPLSSQTGTSAHAGARIIRGIVKSGDGDLLAGVAMKIRATSYAALTDEQGSFAFTLSEADSQADSYSLVGTKADYLDYSATVQAADFAKDIADLAPVLYSSKVTLQGTVKEGSTLLSGVAISSSAFEQTALTDNAGAYTLTIDRPVERLALKFSKDFYQDKEVTIEHATPSKTQCDVDLSLLNYTLSGIVSNYHFGAVSGASVSIEGTDFTTVTGSDGSYRFDAISKVALPYVVTVKHDGYMAMSKTISDAQATADFDLRMSEVSTGVFATALSNFIGYITKDSQGFYFRFESTTPFQYEAGKEEKVQLFVNPGPTSETSRAGGHVAEFALTSNGSIVVVFNYKTNSAVGTIKWGDEVQYTNDTTSTKTTLNLFFKYSIFNDYFGADWAIDAESRIGISLGEWSDFNSATPWAGWDRSDILGYNGLAFVHPEIPKDYVRVDYDNTLYQGYDNTKVEKGTYEVKGRVSNGTNALSGVAISVANTALAATSDASGNYSFLLQDALYAILPDMTFALTGYESQEKILSRDDFTNKVATIDITMKALPTTKNLSGVVSDINGPVSGAVVAVVGTSYSATTGSDGAYALTDMTIAGTSYQVSVTKTGYVTQTLTNAVENSSLNVLLVLEAVNSGAFAADIGNWNCAMTRDATKFSFVLTSSNSFLYDSATNKAQLVSIFLTFGTAAAARDGSTTIELKFNANNWIGVWNYKTSAWATWTSDVAYSLSTSGTTTTATVSVSYAYINGLADFAVSKTDSVGITFGEWTDFNTTTPWEGWAFGTFGFVDPSLPNHYVRWDSKNALTAPEV
jgi:hypothetical protein